MNRGTWWAQVHGAQRVRHDWMTACTHKEILVCTLRCFSPGAKFQYLCKCTFLLRLFIVLFLPPPDLFIFLFSPSASLLWARVSKGVERRPLSWGEYSWLRWRYMTSKWDICASFWNSWGEHHKTFTILRWIVAVGTLTELCSHQFFMVPKHFIIPQRNPVAIKQLLPTPKATTSLQFFSMNLPILDVLCSRIIKYVTFWVWLLSFCLIFLRFIPL